MDATGRRKAGERGILEDRVGIMSLSWVVRPVDESSSRSKWGLACLLKNNVTFTFPCEKGGKLEQMLVGVPGTMREGKSLPRNKTAAVFWG